MKKLFSRGLTLFFVIFLLSFFFMSCRGKLVLEDSLVINYLEEEIIDGGNFNFLNNGLVAEQRAVITVKNLDRLQPIHILAITSVLPQFEITMDGQNAFTFPIVLSSGKSLNLHIHFTGENIVSVRSLVRIEYKFHKYEGFAAKYFTV